VVYKEETMQLSNPEPNTSENDSAEYQKGLRRDPPRILLAEDDDDLRTLIGSSLRMDGYQVIEARDGGELLDMIADWLVYKWPEDPVDLILSDVRMPGYSGMEVLSGLRKAHWDTPVVLITAHGNMKLRTEASRLGASAVLGKPFDLDDLRTTVLHVITHNRPVLSPRLLLRRHEIFDSIDREYTLRSDWIRNVDVDRISVATETVPPGGSSPYAPPDFDTEPPKDRHRS
jgi:two-component system, response regulator, stage 0 sporulation protein F